MKHILFFTLLGLMFSAPVSADEVSSPAAAIPDNEQPGVQRFDINRYLVEGSTLLSQSEIDAALAPYKGKGKDFSDVQRALEAIEVAYVERGFSAVRVTLPEQDLEKGDVFLRVVESHLGRVTVKNNHFVSQENALNAVPSVRSGNPPRAGKISGELKLANENPARQMKVVLKAGEKDDEVDATVFVTDEKPGRWTLTADNTGTPDTGRSRVGVLYRHANLLDKDHVGSMQLLISPEHPNRMMALAGNYKIPIYKSGDSMDLFAGYSSVNSVVGGGLGNLQGGGLLFGVRYNHPLAHTATFDPRLSFGLDFRDYRRIELVNPTQRVLYNELVVTPLTATYATQGHFARSTVNFNASFSANLPVMGKGRSADFAAYDQMNFTLPDPNYKVVRYGANYSHLLGDDGQFRAAIYGQWSRDVLIQGEQIRLGGVDGVRGFSEGSESGDRGVRWNLEAYTPSFGTNGQNIRALAFFDAGEVRSGNGGFSSISSTGLGLRAIFNKQLSLRVDAGRIVNSGNDMAQQAGDWLLHLGISAGF